MQIFWNIGYIDFIVLFHRKIVSFTLLKCHYFWFSGHKSWSASRNMAVTRIPDTVVWFVLWTIWMQDRGPWLEYLTKSILCYRRHHIIEQLFPPPHPLGFSLFNVLPQKIFAGKAPFERFKVNWKKSHPTSFWILFTSASRVILVSLPFVIVGVPVSVS